MPENVTTSRSRANRGHIDTHFCSVHLMFSENFHCESNNMIHVNKKSVFFAAIDSPELPFFLPSELAWVINDLKLDYEKKMCVKKNDSRLNWVGKWLYPATFGMHFMLFFDTEHALNESRSTHMYGVWILDIRPLVCWPILNWLLSFYTFFTLCSAITQLDGLEINKSIFFSLLLDWWDGRQGGGRAIG